MKIRDRLSHAIKAYNQQGMYSALGTVLRNYAKEPAFRPEDQLKGITYKAIDKIGQSVSKYKPQVDKRNGEVYENHPLYVLASMPNQRQNGTYFHHIEAMLYEIYGETFWYLVRGELTNKVKEIYLLNPAQIELVVHDGEFVGYMLHKTSGEQIPFEPSEIIHNKRPNPFNEWRGMSVMERAAQYIDIELVTTKFTLNYMKNNASPSGIVALPNMTKETFNQFAQQWREGYEGPENAGKTAFIRGGEASFKAVGATLKDVDQKVTRDMAKDDLLMMFDMPKGMLGASGDKGMGRSETEALEYIFAKWKVEPMLERLDSIYNQILNYSPVKERVGQVTHISTIPTDKEFTLQQNDKGIGRWITQNEARQTMGLPPINGGDVLAPPKETSMTPTPPTKSAKKITLKKELSKGQKAKQLNEDRKSSDRS